MAAGIDFQHPADEQNEEILNRRSKMVEYRAHLSKHEEVKIAAEREQIKRMKQLRQSGASKSPRSGVQTPPQMITGTNNY